jgi:hypothetical protein
MNSLPGGRLSGRAEITKLQLRDTTGSLGLPQDALDNLGNLGKEVIQKVRFLYNPPFTLLPGRKRRSRKRHCNQYSFGHRRSSDHDNQPRTPRHRSRNLSRRRLHNRPLRLGLFARWSRGRWNVSKTAKEAPLSHGLMTC